MQTCYVYIPASIRRVLYIGMTSDLEKHVDGHWFKAHPGSFSAQYRCNRLVHFAMKSLSSLATLGMTALCDVNYP